MLKRYIEFINEDYDTSLDFNTAINEAASDLGNYSFSTMYKENYHSTPEENYKEFQNELDKYGFTFERIRDNFEGDFEGDTITEYVNRHSIDCLGGLVDVYLYILYGKLGLDKDLIQLGGDGWPQYVFEHDGEEPEAVIRYAYGYHKTTYGKIALEQAGLDTKEFINLAITGIIKTDLNNIVKNFTSYIPNIDDYLIQDDDRILVMTKDIADKLKEYDINLSNEELQDSFINNLSNFHLDDFDKTNDSLIVY